MPVASFSTCQVSTISHLLIIAYLYHRKSLGHTSILLLSSNNVSIHPGHGGDEFLKFHNHEEISSDDLVGALEGRSFDVTI